MEEGGGQFCQATTVSAEHCRGVLSRCLMPDRRVSFVLKYNSDQNGRAQRETRGDACAGRTSSSTDLKTYIPLRRTPGCLILLPPFAFSAVSCFVLQRHLLRCLTWIRSVQHPLPSLSKRHQNNAHPLARTNYTTNLTGNGTSALLPRLFLSTSCSYSRIIVHTISQRSIA